MENGKINVEIMRVKSWKKMQVTKQMKELCWKLKWIC